MLTGEGALDVRHADVDGVPVLWLPVDGPLTAGLHFRVGRADETLARGGITHLMEHLALYRQGVESPHRRMNGFVDQVTTAFHVQGDQADVVAFLCEICEWLHDLPLDRLAVERSILRSEASQNRPPTVAGSLLSWRFGARTYGLPAFEQYGLLHLGPDDVREWATAHATRENAVVWLTGEPPDGLRLPLPEGERRSVPEASTASPAFPAWYQDGTGSAAALAVVERSVASTALREVLDRRLVRNLRYELGATYSPVVQYDPIGPDRALLWLVAEAVDGHDEAVAREILGALDAVAAGEVDDEVLSAWRSRGPGELAHDPAARRGWLFAQAFDHLTGKEAQDFDAWVAGMAATDGEAVSGAAAAAASTAMYRLPEGLRHPPAFYRAPLWSSRTYEGRRYRAVRGTHDEPETVLEVEEAGISLIRADGNVISIGFADCEALLVWPDGRRVLLGADSFMLEVQPAWWIDGRRLVDEIDRLVAADRRVPMPEVADTEQPPPPQVGEPWSLWVTAGLGVLAAVVILGGMVAGTLSFSLAPVLVGLFGVGVVTRNLVRTRRARGLPAIPGVRR